MAEWNKLNVPHKGWQCIGVLDLGEDADSTEDIEYEQCEMCGNEKIRYVHIMKHSEYPEELHVGCVCAEKMSEDYVNPRRRETELRNRFARKQNFNRAEWSFNPEKNSYTKKYKGEYITIIKSRYGNNWGVYFADQNRWQYNGEKILSFESAEKVAFEMFERYHMTAEEKRELEYY